MEKESSKPINIDDVSKDTNTNKSDNANNNNLKRGGSRSPYDFRQLKRVCYNESKSSSTPAQGKKKTVKKAKSTLTKKVVPSRSRSRSASSRRSKAESAGTGDESDGAGSAGDDGPTDAPPAATPPDTYYPPSMYPVNYTEEEVRRALRSNPRKNGQNKIASDTFDSVGGLKNIVDTLRETLSLPLCSPEFYKKFQIRPTRGMIFHGPPGVGKTMVARALVNACSSQCGQKVAFFMRKGSDLLDPYLGQSEENMRKLFTMAHKLSPSVIFFDEIDALAPRRSQKEIVRNETRVVSTLLALMDGMDDRGMVFVIGATNRLDTIDPALRRPGRFDVEFYFPLPNLEARKEILTKMTESWKIKATILDEIAKHCCDFNGADLAGLCQKAAENALKRANPQLNLSCDRTKPSAAIRLSNIKVDKEDFEVALTKIIPTNQRTGTVVCQRLDENLQPLLMTTVDEITNALQEMYPKQMASDDSIRLPFDTRRFLLCYDGLNMAEQTSIVCRAIFYHYDGIKVCEISQNSLACSDSPMEALLKTIREAKRAKHGIVFVKNIDQLCPEGDHSSMRSLILNELRGIGPDLPLLIFATSSTPSNMVPTHVRDLDFTIKDLREPNNAEKKEFFIKLFNDAIDCSGDSSDNKDSSAALQSKVPKLAELAMKNCNCQFSDIYEYYRLLSEVIFKNKKDTKALFKELETVLSQSRT